MAILTVFQGLTVPTTAPTPSEEGVLLGDAQFANLFALLVSNTSLGAADSITVRMWGRDFGQQEIDANTQDVAPEWYPLGNLADGSTNLTKGTINFGNVIDANNADNNSANHAEIIMSLRGFQAVYAQVLAGVVGTWSCILQTRDPGNQGLGMGR